MGQRKVVQLVVVDETIKEPSMLYAVADDGTAWERPLIADTASAWRQLTPLPSDGLL